MDFYLSEMSVSDLHGGGLTLQRVLQSDLNKIKYFFHVSRFGSDLPANKSFLERSVTIDMLFEKNWVRKIIGRSLSASMAKKRFIITQYATNAAKIIDEKLNAKNERVFGLVCPQGLHSLLTIEALKKRRTVRYMTWIMDDHLIQWDNGDWKYPRGVQKIFYKHLREAEHIFVISPVMQEFYYNKFGVNSTVLFGSSEFSDPIKAQTLSCTDTLKIGYFGAVAGWQLDVLETMSKVLPSVNARLDIYSGMADLPKEIKNEWVSFKGRVDQTKVLSTMRNYDAILLPISFDSLYRNMSRFNIATKMSECLASGVVTIVIGPEHAAMIEYLKKYNAAILATSKNTKSIVEAFDTLYDEHQVRCILQNAQKLGVNEIGTNAMHSKWTSIMNSLALS